MNVPLVDLRVQHAELRDEISRAIGRVIEAQAFILGDEVDSFERAVAGACRMRHAIGMSSGTDALLASLMALGVGPGDEIVTTPYTFVATASCAARLGARARFVDIDPQTMCIDVTRVAAAIGPRTKAIVPVHLFGRRVDVGDHGVPVVEDAAQAFGVRLGGACATLSFFPSKNLGAFGDAGMVVTNDDALAARLRLLRVHGQEAKYASVAIGGNFRLDALQAAVLRVKLPHVTRWNEARRRAAATYRAMLAGVNVPAEAEEHVWNQFVIRSERRDALREELTRAGIETAVHYPTPLHLQKCFAEWGYREGDFPEAERASRETLALPIFPGISDDQIGRVVDVLRSAAHVALAR